MNPQTQHIRRQGFLLTGLGVLVLSPDGLLVKITTVDSAVLLFWRGLLLAGALLLIGLLRYRRRWVSELKKCGWRGGICATGFAGSTLGFVVGMKHTAAGNVLVILNTAPVIAAVMAWAVWRERLPGRTWGVILVCVAGAGLMAWAEMGRGQPLGLVMAAFAALALATNLNVARSRPQSDMSLVLFAGALLVAVGAAVMGGARMPAWADMRYILLLCLVFLPVASTLIQIGPQFLPAAEVSLMLLLETVFGSLLVWWFLGEVPPTLSLWGGGIILATLVANGLWETHQERRRRYWVSSPP